ncbi:class I adenylate-forming enzyme family protein [Quisquiliibacterium transsilvanicum]|uniref:Long-chain acyl-CoA synthetase n=1 Tax=Quisquiliibacterium transsilvanicum TaxID=1549638 RepID=A0A7W8HHB2_9BURK|nr:class I adenylate-forming enzyme family protein [Quisquiliibacterium transsilvanicum]MBB5271245.1 long-chain acyl-CoA synthetase [Quisquiliibacterium transsilvanicum]
MHRHLLDVNTNLRSVVERTPDKVAAISRSRSLTYSQLDRRIDKVANALLASGLREGDAAAVFARNRIEWIELLFGCARAGVTCVPVNARFAQAEVDYVLQHSQPRLLVCEDELLDGLMAGGSPLDPSCIVVLGDRPGGLRAYEDWLAPASEKRVEVPSGIDTCWFLGYTSGTTGRPKAVIKTQHRLAVSALYAASAFGLRASDTSLIVMPLFHANGIFFQLVQLSVGGTIYVMEQFDAEEALRVIDQHRISFASLVPTMYSLIMDLPVAVSERYDRSSFRSLLSSSAPLAMATKYRMREFFPGAAMHEFYGATETGLVTHLAPADQMRKEASVGQAFPGVEVRLRRADGSESAVGEVGEIHARGVAFAYEGYYKDPELTARSFDADGWFSAGDLATRDDEGFFHLVDRKNDLIISGGENIYPTEVEGVLLGHPAIAEVAVVGEPDEKWGDRVCAVVRLHEGESLSAEQLRAWCRDRIASYKIPRKLLVWNEIPRNPTGKVLRRVIRERLRA